MDLKIGNNYLFDTTVYIDSLRNNPLQKDAVRKLMFQARDNRISVGYSIITEIELWAGIKGLWTVEQHEVLLAPMRRYLLGVRIAKRAGNILSLLAQAQIKSIGMADCVIAATAEYHNLILITRNPDDFNAIITHTNVNIVIEGY